MVFLNGLYLVIPFIPALLNSLSEYRLFGLSIKNFDNMMIQPYLSLCHLMVQFMPLILTDRCPPTFCVRLYGTEFTLEVWFVPMFLANIVLMFMQL